MLAAMYVEALLANEALADEVWDSLLFPKADIQDRKNPLKLGSAFGIPVDYGGSTGDIGHKRPAEGAPLPDLKKNQK